MMIGRMLLPDGCWHTLSVCFWLLAVPFVSAAVFVLVALVTILLHRRRGAFYRLFLYLTIVFGFYTAFNAVDYLIYRYCGGMAISPVNQGVFGLFCPPSDLYVPYAKVELHPNVREYTMEFQHKYGERQGVALHLMNGNPKEFDYDHPDVIGLSFSGDVVCIEGGERVLLVNEAFSTYFLQDGENRLSLGRYEIGTWGQLAKKYRATIRINGDLAAFIRRYPGSYLAVANSTTE